MKRLGAINAQVVDQRSHKITWPVNQVGRDISRAMSLVEKADKELVFQSATSTM